MNLMAGAVCAEEAAGRFESGCVHEHVKTGWLCASHAAVKLTAICGRCLAGPPSHVCPVVIRELTA
jgi:hypothetical protein